MHGYKLLCGGDLDENGNFISGKLVMFGYKIRFVVYQRNDLLSLV